MLLKDRESEPGRGLVWTPDPSGRARKGLGNNPAKKSRDPSTRGNCSQFCNFSPGNFFSLHIKRVWSIMMSSLDSVGWQVNSHQVSRSSSGINTAFKKVVVPAPELVCLLDHNIPIFSHSWAMLGGQF